MPEGDTIFRTARTLHHALAGRVVSRFDTVLPALARVDADHPIAGRTVESVAARGKHLLMTFSGGLVLHTHMRMHGAWHVYRPGDRWRRPACDMRVLVAAGDVVAVGFRVPVAELLTAPALARHPHLGGLGPDLLAEPFDAAEAVRRVRGHPRAAIGEVLLDQRVVAGIGNVFRSEVLFAAGVNPFTPPAAHADDVLHRVLAAARRLLRVNVMDRSRALSAAIGRRTTGAMDPRAALWVYGRAGRPCRRCGGRIEARRTGVDGRLTFWCPTCQP